MKMFFTINSRRFILILFALALFSAHPVFAQDRAAIEQTKAKAFRLMDEQKYLDALPLLERLSIEVPDDPRIFFLLGFALVGKANVTKDEAEKTTLRVRSRRAFIKAKELGIREPVVDSLIASLPADGSSRGTFSPNAEANELVTEGERSFSKGDMDDALRSYGKALKLDPNIYEAALFSGDIYVTREDYKKAEEWYQRAITIDPNRETAYRYSATPLMKQRKFDEARDRYVEAYISEPYNRFSQTGLMQWSQVTGVPVGNPELDIPDRVEVDSSGKVKVDIGPNALLAGREDGTYFWSLYAPVRSKWRQEGFRKAFPKEAAYRHSLPEETEALRAVLTAVKTEKSVKKLDRSLERLIKLDEQGLLESYILLARSDEGISQDHPAYLKDHRDQLRRYVKEHVIGPKDDSGTRTASRKDEETAPPRLVERSYDSAGDKTTVKTGLVPITCVTGGCIFFSDSCFYQDVEWQPRPALLNYSRWEGL